MDRIIREVTEIKLHPNNTNRDDRFSLSRQPDRMEESSLQEHDFLLILLSFLVLKRLDISPVSLSVSPDPAFLSGEL
jgi:hypothetical protein